MKRITPAQHQATSLTKLICYIKYPDKSRKRFEYERFSKPGEPQADAIRRLMSSIKRNTRKAETRSYPSTGVVKTTKQYVERYYLVNALGKPPFTNLNDQPTTWPESLEVEFTEVDDDISDLI